MKVQRGSKQVQGKCTPSVTEEAGALIALRSYTSCSDRDLLGTEKKATNGIRIKHVRVQASKHKLCNYDASAYESNAPLIFVLKMAIAQYRDNKIYAYNLKYFFFL